jgi:hypothetical protein
MANRMLDQAEKGIETVNDNVLSPAVSLLKKILGPGFIFFKWFCLIFYILIFLYGLYKIYRMAKN